MKIQIECRFVSNNRFTDLIYSDSCLFGMKRGYADGAQRQVRLLPPYKEVLNGEAKFDVTC